jgi:hypothetical protein
MIANPGAPSFAIGNILAIGVLILELYHKLVFLAGIGILPIKTNRKLGWYILIL